MKCPRRSRPMFWFITPQRMVDQKTAMFPSYKESNCTKTMILICVKDNLKRYLLHIHFVHAAATERNA